MDTHKSSPMKGMLIKPRVQIRKIRNIFELEDDEPEEASENKIRVSYNETIFFNQSINNDNKMNQYLHNVLSSTLSENEEINKAKSKPNINSNSAIKLNVKINNTYYTSNVNYLYPNNETKSSMKQDQYNFTVSYIDNSNELFYVPCLNCGKEVYIQDIESHSLNCTKITDDVLKEETTSYSYHTIDYKLRKLQEHLISIKSSETLDEEMKEIAERLIEYINKSLSHVRISYDSIKELKRIVTCIDTLSQACPGSMYAWIIIDRAKILIKEKWEIFRNDFKITQDNNNKSKIECPTQSPLKKFNDSLDNEHKPFSPSSIRLTKNRLCDIDSAVDNHSIQSELSECTSLSSASTVKDAQYFKPGDVAINGQPPNPKDIKDFVALVLKVKFEKLHNTHQGQQIPEKALFKECMRLNIPKNRWQEFIRRELTQPSKYQLKTSRTNQKPKIYLINPSMEIIDEENIK